MEDVINAAFYKKNVLASMGTFQKRFQIVHMKNSKVFNLNTLKNIRRIEKKSTFSNKL